MVSLAMVALLISLARNLMKELVKKEHVERVALAEVNETYGFPLARDRMLNYQNNENKNERKYLWFKLAVIVILMSMSWFMIFEVNETYGFP
eukprot:s9866_g1.t1